MSTPTAQCPHCFAHVRAPDGTTSVECPSCERTFTPTVKVAPSRKDPHLPVAKAIPPGGAAATPADADKPAEAKPDELPRARAAGTARRSRRDEVDTGDRPRPRSRRRYEDDDDDRPVAKKPGGSALPIILIAGGLLLLLTLGGAAAVAVAVWANTGTATATTKAYAVMPAPDVAENRDPRGNWNDQEPFLEPGGPGPVGPGGGPPVGPGWGGGGPGGPGMPGDPLGGRPKVQKPAPKFADVTPLEIKPTKLAEETGEVKLPGKVADSCVGGGGRFFILHLSDKRQLAIFDVTEAKVVKYLPLAADNAKFAAGMNKLIVAYPDTHTLARYDLTTFEKEDSQKCPADGTIKRVAMGSASAGPLLVALAPNNGGGPGGGTSKLDFIDPSTFKAVDVDQENAQQWRVWADNDHFRASPDGRVFTAHGVNGLNSFTFRGGNVKHAQANEAFGHLTPGSDGHLYAANGLFTPDFKRVGRTPRNGVHPSVLPAAEGFLYLQLTANAQQPGAFPGEGQKWKADVKMNGDDRSLFTFKDVGPFTADPWAPAAVPTDARVHFAPSAKLFVSVPAANDKLVLHKFDLEAAFEASGVDYLYLTSRPRTVVPGKGFDYQIVAKSKKGGVKYTLEAGPKGLTVDAGGKVSWAAPADFAGPETVIVTVADASGQELFHAFDLAAGDGRGWAPPPSAAAKVAADQPGGKGGPLVTTPDRVFELKPPNVQEKASVTLPGTADAVCVGGGGRFLVLRLGSKKQLAILDVTAGRVVKYLPLAEGDALVAAGMTKLFVLNKSAGLLLRYDLEKFEKDLTARNPLGGNPTLMLMGHSSDGPLFVGGPQVGADSKGWGFVNPRTLKELPVTLEGEGQHGQATTGPAVGEPQLGVTTATVAISPDGRTLCWSDGWNGTRLLTLGEKAAKVKGNNQFGGGNSPGVLTPGPDGTLFGLMGLYTADLKKVGDAKQPVSGTFTPATSGPWYVSFIDGDRWDPARAKRKIHVGMTADERLKFPIDSLDGLPAVGQDPWAQQQAGKLPMAARLHLVPEAEILAVLDDGMDKVHLHRIPVKTLLQKADTDTLLVVSRPRPAVRGQRWSYAPEVWSKKGGVKVKVESGPDGMKADNGVVTWSVPDKFADDEPTVILTVSDASGQETFHTFALSVRSNPPPAASVIKPTLPPLEGAKPIDPSKLPVRPPVFTLKATAAKDGTDVDLPAAADAACLAGGGRFILFRLPSKKEVSVFDTVDGKVVKQLPLAEDGALIAGGRGHAFVVNPKAGVLQRWNLSTFEKEATTKLPDGLTPQVAVMGHASDGPLYLGNSDRFGGGAGNGFYDPFSVTKVTYTGGPNDPSPIPAPSGPDSLYASADGRVWAWRDTGGWPSGMSSLVIDGKSARRYGSHITAGPIMPGPDGSLFVAGGVFSPEQNKVLDAHSSVVKAGPNGINPGNGSNFTFTGRSPVPASDGPFYLWFPPEKAARPGGAEKPKTEAPQPSLKMVGLRVTLAELEGVRGLAEVKADNPFDGPRRPKPGEESKPALLLHQRLFLIPAAELLAVLSPDGTKIHLHALKVRDRLNGCGEDFLVLMGRPSQFAARGQKWTYTPDVWSKKGGVKVEVASGPAGLKAEGAGVAWDVPADLLDNRVTVELKITDQSGKSLGVRFPLSLDGTVPGAPVLLGDASGTGTAPGKGNAKGNGGDPDLIGTWAVNKMELNGNDVPLPAEFDKLRFTFEKDGTARGTGGPNVGDSAGTYTADPKASPKTLDITTTSGSGKEETQQTVYEVSGDTLRMASPLTPGTGRPAKLGGAETIVMTLRRVKAK